MKAPYLRARLGLLLTLLTWLAPAGQPARGQSPAAGPYGHEWIVPGQRYVKIKIWREGLYRLNEQYLRATGLPLTDPARLQLWRRGREVAVFLGGNGPAVDASTFLEFYGQRNDGRLDAAYYKNPAEQAHQFHSFDTDTAAYFLTYGAQPGRRMTAVAANDAAAPHPHRLASSLRLVIEAYREPAGKVQVPWLQGGEGFMSRDYVTSPVLPLDSLLRGDILASPAPRLEAVVVSGTPFAQSVAVTATPPGGAARPVGSFPIPAGRLPGRFRGLLQKADFTAAGNVTVQFSIAPNAATPRDGLRITYFRVTVAQPNVWVPGRANLWFQNDSTLTGPPTYELADVPATVVGYDVHDPWNVRRVLPTAGEADRRRFVFEPAAGNQTHRLLLSDAARPLLPGQPARLVTFRPIDPVRPSFIIVTHPQLMGPAAGVPNAARAYADYRASVAGGRHDTLMVTSGQLYDQFHYGERSVLALRRFALWLADNAPATRARYLLLLGKGIGPNENLGGFRLIRSVGDMGLNLVPATTRAASDNFFSSDWPNGNYAARLPTGRITARTPQEVIAYLNKLKENDQASLAEWRRNAISLAGGDNESEQRQFDRFTDAYNQRIRRPPFAGRVVRTYRRGDYPGELPIFLDISAELNAGLGLITYFGHGSPTEFNMNLSQGGVANPILNYNNKGKYPFLFYNGCEAGRLFINAPTFAEDWLFAPDRGALALMGQSGVGFASPLHAMQDMLYQVMLNDPAWYGKSVPAAFAEAVRRLQQDQNFMANDESIIAEQLLSTLWHGDPALSVFAPAQADFVASDARLSLGLTATTPGPVPASAREFVLNIGVSNGGQVTTDSIEIEVIREYSARNGTVRPRDRYQQRFRQASGRDTTYAFVLPNEGEVFGQNTFRVALDYRNRVAEQSELNNTAQTTYAFLSGGITLLSPPEFDIVPTATPLLVAQTNDPNGPPRGYEFELDTVPTFNSPALQRRTLEGTLTVDWQPTLPTPAAGAPDSVVWYWRARFAAPGPDPAEDRNWVSSSFRYVPGSPGGWSQSHYGQFQRDALQGLAVAAPGGRWRFAEEERTVSLRTGGGGPAVPRGQSPPVTFIGGQFGIMADPLVPPFLRACATNAPGLMLAVYDQRTLRPLAVPGGPYLTCGRDDQPFYIFAANAANAADTLNNLHHSAARQAELVSLLNNVPAGAYVALISVNRLRYAALPASVREALSTLLGSRLIANNELRNGDPFGLLAQKQAGAGRLIQEAGPDLAAGALPRDRQIISLTNTLRTGGSQGTVTSTRVGPAQRWGTLYHTVRPETPTGTYTLRLLAYDEQGRQSVLNADVRERTLDVSTVSAAQYPYLQLELSLRDAENRTPPQLEQWLLTYTGVPEGVVRRDLAPAGAYDAAALAKQAVDKGFLEFPVVFRNVSGLPFGTPLNARVSVRRAGQEVRSALVAAPNAPAPGANVIFSVKLDVRDLYGELTVQVEVNPLQANPSPQPELYRFNNQLSLPAFSVTDRNVPPVLDVAFDGRRILSGELVSARPLISIQLRDESQLRHLKDSRYFTVLMQRADQPTAEVINLRGANVSFEADSTSRPGTTATLKFEPGKLAALPDGRYTLRVQGRDPANAAAGTQDYQVSFEVVGKSSITNVFPYPNPVTSKARFVFTLTGEVLPNNMKIQILTLTGRVVRELFMADLFPGGAAPMHIGNNLTDYAWDGTDEYGDRLANGTYLYRVSLDEAAGTFEHRQTAGDAAFKKSWGKLVLLR